ncbi:MAG: nucleotide exchange factor GrpE [Bdellovibrionota bacterium]
MGYDKEREYNEDSGYNEMETENILDEDILETSKKKRNKNFKEEGFDSRKGNKKIIKLEAEIGELKKSLEESKEKYLMALADLENYKKRSSKERADLLKYQGEPILVDLLEVLDNLDRALEHTYAKGEASVSEDICSGVKMIHKQFLDVLAKWGVKSENSVGEMFDPTKHNALSRVPAKDAKVNEIISEFKKLYYYKDKILRHAQVVVCSSEQDN